MKKLQTLTILLFGLTVLSCNHTKKTQDNKAQTDSIAQLKENSIVTADTLVGLLNKSLKTDTLEFNSREPFIFFKSGYIISQTEKNAIAIICPTDTNYSVKLFCLRDNKWEMTDSIGGLDAFQPQFDIIYDDFNFDKQTDLYIQVSASNGWSLSRGHLLIIDPLTKKLTRHDEARDLANMRPDPKTKTVASELWNGYNMQGQHQLTIFTNKWVNGRLKTVKKKDITLKY